MCFFFQEHLNSTIIICSTEAAPQLKNLHFIMRNISYSCRAGETAKNSIQLVLITSWQNSSFIIVQNVVALLCQAEKDCRQTGVNWLGMLRKEFRGYYCAVLWMMSHTHNRVLFAQIQLFIGSSWFLDKIIHVLAETSSKCPICPFCT